MPVHAIPALRRFLVACLLAACELASAANPRSPVLLIASADGRSSATLQPSIANTIAYMQRSLDVAFDIRKYPWNRLLQNLNNGEGLALGLSKTQERLQTLHFSDPVYANYVWLVTRSDAVFPFRTLSDLKGKSLGVTRGSSYGEAFEREKNILFDVEEDEFALSARLNKLLNHRMDALLFQHRGARPEQVETLLNSWAAQHQLPLPPGVSFRVLPKPLLIDPIHFAIRADLDDGLIARINQAIAKGKRNGELLRALDAGTDAPVR
jgi:ABC-type amino acid transport substrate-binding protein